MTPTQQNTARALARHPRFKWLRGMSMLRDAPGKADNLRLEVIVTHGREELDGIPDLCDPATIGAIGALARELTGVPTLHLAYATHRADWFVAVSSTSIYMNSKCCVFCAPTEGEAWAELILSLPHA